MVVPHRGDAPERVQHRRGALAGDTDQVSLPRRRTPAFALAGAHAVEHDDDRS
jgi:hypothetical protein